MQERKHILLLQTGEPAPLNLIVQTRVEGNGAGSLDIGHCGRGIGRGGEDNMSADEALLDRPLGRVLGGLGQEDVDGVGAAHAVLQGGNVCKVLVLREGAVGQGHGAVGVGEGTVGGRGGRGGGCCGEVASASPGGGGAAVEAVDGGSDGVAVGVAGGLNVVVAQDGGLADRGRGPEAAVDVAAERGQRRVDIEDSAGAGGEGAGPLSLGLDIAVRVEDLKHGQEAVDVGVVEPEERVHGGVVDEAHVAAATDHAVHDVVDGLDAVVAAAVVRVPGRVAELVEVGVGAEQDVDAVTERDPGVVEPLAGYLVAADGVRGGAGRVPESGGIDGEGSLAGTELTERVEPVRVQRVGNLPAAGGRVAPDAGAGDDVGQGSGAAVAGDVEVGHTQGGSRSGVPLALGSLELVDDFEHVCVQRLLEEAEVGPMPGGEDVGGVGAVARILIAGEGSHAVPGHVRASVDGLKGRLAPCM